MWNVSLDRVCAHVLEPEATRQNGISKKKVKFQWVFVVVVRPWRLKCWANLCHNNVDQYYLNFDASLANVRVAFGKRKISDANIINQLVSQLNFKKENDKIEKFYFGAALDVRRTTVDDSAKGQLNLIWFS